MPDPIEALRAFLRADAAIDGRVDGRVFAGELPRKETEQMPREAVVIRPGGGPDAIGGGYQSYGDLRLDVLCYGSTPHNAWLLHLDVHAALKDLKRKVFAETLLHWARPSVKGQTGRDPEKDWPLTLSSWQVLASEIAVP